MSWPLRMTLNISLIAFPFFIYLFWRLTVAANVVFNFPYRRSLWIMPVVLVFVYLLPLYLLVFVKGAHNPSSFLYSKNTGWQDWIMTYPFWVAVVIMVESVIYFISIDLIKLMLYVFRVNTGYWPHVFQMIILAWFIIYVPFRISNDTGSVNIREFRFDLQQKSQDVADISLVLVGDIQVDRYTQGEKLDRLRKAVEQSKPDILFFAGDLVTDGSAYIESALKTIGKMKAAYRIACMGDHDYWAAPNRIADGVRKAGWKFLENQHFVFDYQGKRILVTGVTYIYSKRLTQGNLEQLLAKAPLADFKILLVHQPSEMVIQTATRHGYHLLLAGHTHGGQILFRPFGFELTPSMFENKIYSGVGFVNRMPVVVTNGIGLTMAPIRYQAPAEIIKILF